MTAAIELWYDNGQRRKWQDDSTRTYTEWAEDGTVTLSRPYNAQENAEADQRARTATETRNGDTIRQRASQALQVNADYLAIATPTNADVVKQVRALTQEASGLIRLALRRFDADA